MIATVSPVPYWSLVALAIIGCILLCVKARRHPGKWRITVARVIGLALAADVITYTMNLVIVGTWSPRTSLPLALCDVGVLVAAIASWWPVPSLVELTYFWGMTGALLALVTPDLNVGFPHLVFFEFVVGHVGIVVAGPFLVFGLRRVPRPNAIVRVFVITVIYTAFVGFIDGVTGANYMFLRQPPGEWTMLRLLGPWPWYTVSAASLAFVFFTLLDIPFWAQRRGLSKPHQDQHLEVA